ncbi:alpha/beta hydrolase [Streptomyces roseirectus]|uniref:Alpha/beta hydrolase n=1 Tax=Streptomyces roseirectus TaxID=2768066 RepID=A0A7H0IJQ6_9ACTN|nr:alpha/beta hydrolase [Streptomyces roseirectus]QNP73022.1 alpha/beta hydrolase [Streptomyces roseirectus]
MTRFVTRRAVLGGMAAGAVAGAGLGGNAWAAKGTSASTAAEPYVAFPVGAGGGPAGSDRVHALQIGDPAAGTVLVLVPGQFGAANDFRLLARDLVAAVPGVQVWAVDRREENLADRAGFATADPLAYYLDGHYHSQDPAASGFMADWGLPQTLSDLRTVVEAASCCGRRKVILGGHSWGATTAAVYAAWDFDGRPGHRDLAGLALIDGGVLGAFNGGGEAPDNSAEKVRQRLDAISGGAVFDMSLAAVGVGTRSESTQIWYQLAGWYAHLDPHGTSVLQPRLPDALRPANTLTNAALLGLLVDQSFGWPNDISVHSGTFSATGDWTDTGITPISRVATAYAGPEPTVWQWYWPARLSVDLDAADVFADTDVTRSLGLRIQHATGIDVPLFAFQTSAYQGTAVTAAQKLASASRVPFTSFQTDTTMNHLDPLFAATAKNTATQSLATFVRRLV